MSRQFLALLAIVLAGCAIAKAPAPQSFLNADPQPIAVDAPEQWAAISKTLGVAGTFAREVYTITVPRDDLAVSVDGAEVPPAAGLDSQIYFFKCPCGRMSVTGHLVVADYEVNDVIAELQKNGAIKIASVASVLLGEKPRVMAIQFFGEGATDELAANLKNALDYTGPRRLAPQKPDDR